MWREEAAQLAVKLLGFRWAGTEPGFELPFVDSIESFVDSVHEQHEFVLR